MRADLVTIYKNIKKYSTVIIIKQTNIYNNIKIIILKLTEFCKLFFRYKLALI